MRRVHGAQAERPGQVIRVTDSDEAGGASLAAWCGGRVTYCSATPMDSTFDTGAIVRDILTGYALPPRGYHGVVHWARVLENGMRLAAETGANPRVVTLFALFHDARRLNEGRDTATARAVPS